MCSLNLMILFFFHFDFLFSFILAFVIVFCCVQRTCFSSINSLLLSHSDNSCDCINLVLATQSTPIFSYNCCYIWHDLMLQSVFFLPPPRNHHIVHRAHPLNWCCWYEDRDLNCEIKCFCQLELCENHFF